ncbi:hypothetical protein HDE_10808 [Halotydeus destructor]|nr:hypothetical protein HDE_10808 [Halotydeus destructor]
MFKLLFVTCITWHGYSVGVSGQQVDGDIVSPIVVSDNETQTTTLNDIATDATTQLTSQETYLPNVADSAETTSGGPTLDLVLTNDTELTADEQRKYLYQAVIELNTTVAPSGAEGMAVNQTNSSTIVSATTVGPLNVTTATVNPLKGQHRQRTWRQHLGISGSVTVNANLCLLALVYASRILLLSTE